jgi:hypothetical protein
VVTTQDCHVVIPPMKAALLALVAVTFLTFIASAADIRGTWIVDAPEPEGNRGGSMDFSTYEFKVSGTTLSGSITRPGGVNAMVQIADGKIDGDSFRFTATMQGHGGIVSELNYTGTIVGDSIRLSIHHDDQGNTVTLKRGSYR